MEFLNQERMVQVKSVEAGQKYKFTILNFHAQINFPH